MVIKLNSMQDCAIEMEKNGYRGLVELTATTCILTKVSNDSLNDALANNIKDILEEKSHLYEPIIPFWIKANIDENDITKVKAIVPITKNYFRDENYALATNHEVFKGITLSNYKSTEINVKKKFFKDAKQLPHPDRFGFNIEINDIVSCHDVLWITKDVTNLRIKLHRLCWDNKKSYLVKYNDTLIADPTETILVKSANPSKKLVLTDVDINKL